MNDRQALFAALADPTRRAIFEQLSTTGPASATRIAHELPISRQAVAKHLATLADAGLVDRSTAGREVQFIANHQPLTDIEDWLSNVGTAWDARLARLRTVLEEE